jgi:hypothetical protein
VPADNRVASPRARDEGLGEAALTAIRIFNNPQLNFKSEMFITLMMIAWTHLLHACFRAKKVEYRGYTKGQKTDRVAAVEFRRHPLGSTAHDGLLPWRGVT